MIVSDSAAPIETTVAVVGGGPAGLALTLALARAGVPVALIESGRTEPDAFATDLAAAEQVSPPGHPRLEATSQRRLGGASWIWGGRCVALDPVDFGSRPFSAPGWPITQDEAFAEAEAAAAFLGVGAPEFDETAPWAPPGSGLQTRVERWSADPRLARARAAELRDSPARIHTGLTCTAIRLDPAGGHVVGLDVKGRSGAVQRVKARHYVIAAGGLETARLLLASNDVRAGGIDGGSDWLGKGYMGHLQGGLMEIALEGLTEAAVDYRRDPSGADVRTRFGFTTDVLAAHSLMNIAFWVENPPLGDAAHGSGALSAAALALQAPGLGVRLMTPQIQDVVVGPKRSPALRHAINLLADPLGAGGFVFNYLKGVATGRRRAGVFVRNKRRRYLLRYAAEQSPLPESRVRLSNRQDALGLPRLIVEKRIAEADVESVLHAHDLLAEALAAAGLARLVPLHRSKEALAAQVRADGVDGYHQIGIARMGATARDGVVDRDCQVHGIANLHLAGSAVFPTSGQANPTFLIVCLALRLAKRLVARV